MSFDSNQCPMSVRMIERDLDWLGFERTSIVALHGSRFAGQPGYTLRKRLRLASQIILAHSETPLHLSILFGLAIALSSGTIGAYMVLRSLLLEHYAVLGWTSLMVSVFFMGGIVLTVQGIMGIYIGKIFSELKGRPLYVVGETVGFGRMRNRKAGRSNVDIMEAVEKTGHRKPAAQIETPSRLVAAFGHHFYGAHAAGAGQGEDSVYQVAPDPAPLVEHR